MSRVIEVIIYKDTSPWCSQLRTLTSDCTACFTAPMPGIAMSRIRQLVLPTQLDARNSSADDTASDAKPNSPSKSGVTRAQTRRH